MNLIKWEGVRCNLAPNFFLHMKIGHPTDGVSGVCISAGGGAVSDVSVKTLVRPFFMSL